jgi:heptosyltransferase-3
VLVHPAARFFFKCWTEERTAEMLDRLASQGEKIVITSGPSDEERTMIEKIVSLLKVAKPIVLIGKTPSMKTFAALIDDAKLLIGVDSAPAHMAAALQTPEVILFGATIPGRWRPWENNASRVVISPGRCHFCEQRGCGRCGISECMREIRVEDVMEAANELLEHRDIPDAYRKTVYGPNDRFPTYS